jgi:uncharacterized protein with von Willebrand factor type A (vWA) domain
MLLNFFLILRRRGLSVSLREYLDLLEALEQEAAAPCLEEFYFLCRTVLVKHEQQLDLFDQLFGEVFGQLQEAAAEAFKDIPEEWLYKQGLRQLSEEEKEQLKAFGGMEELMERFHQLMEEQKERHQGGNKWIGTGGTSPFGAWGYNPAGYRIGQNRSRHRQAVKVWDERQFKELDDSRELDTRQFKMALRRLRMLSREGQATEFDLPETIRRTSRNGGLLDLAYTAPKTNAPKMLLLLDIGGSMDDHISLCEQLFSASRYEFKQLEHFYFHNCLYERVWKNAERRHSEAFPTEDLFHTYGKDCKVIVVGDASMSPYELIYTGGSVEHMNKEAGSLWLQRLRNHFTSTIWLNPVPKAEWPYTESIGMVQALFPERMFPLTLAGLEAGIQALQKRG